MPNVPVPMTALAVQLQKTACHVTDVAKEVD